MGVFGGVGWVASAVVDDDASSAQDKVLLRLGEVELDGNEEDESLSPVWSGAGAEADVDGDAIDVVVCLVVVVVSSDVSCVSFTTAALVVLLLLLLVFVVVVVVVSENNPRYCDIRSIK